MRSTPRPVKTQRSDSPYINERIRFPRVRVIDDEGTQLGIMSSREAITIAQEKDLDLVLVSPDADPPVCRIMNYGKFKFEQEKKQREAKKKQHTVDVKEIKMRYTIEAHDYQVRLRNAQKFLAEGDKVKCTIMFRGREIQHADIAKKLLVRLAQDLHEIADVQQEPLTEGKNMIMILGPKKS
ncbi:translation initiation factor IF-3 [Anthocerotibacter panamensis]|uniref:translation initiation factor IF-3 n=1 Tax=Anthocerotibacter panamensis TaxID=2857077 RepID=UPI001FD8CD43|nr:translation initiation factor IF-3 [Anthocerotibacter panamensis]